MFETASCYNMKITT